MDLNGLKRCNDCFGYAAGDALICRAADALNDVFPREADDRMYREKERQKRAARPSV